MASRLYDMEKTRTRSAGTLLFIGAAIAGLLHAAPSFYWMCGGMWLLDTVGPMAVELQQEGNVPVRFLLAAVFIAKVTGALVPLIDHLRPPAHAWVRIVSWVGVLVLIGWGGRGTFAGWQRVVTGQASLSNPLIPTYGVPFSSFGDCCCVGRYSSRALAARKCRQQAKDHSAYDVKRC